MTASQAPDPSRCAVQWRRGDLPAWGTASRTQWWLALEQPGPWGHSAITQSRLDPTLGAALEQRVNGLGGRLVLVRRPGRHAEHDLSRDGHTVLLNGGAAAGTPWVASGHVREPADLLGLLDDLEPGQRPRWAEPRDAVLLVCTNARRDQCCALDGRPLAAELSAAHPDQVWEVTHLGGHRFSPTALCLPTGQMLARLDAETGARALAEAARGRAVAAGPVHDRGLSHLEPPAQVADVWARSHDLPATVSRVEQHQEGWEVTLTGPTRPPRRVRVWRTEGPEHLTSSCAKAPVPAELWHLADLADPRGDDDG